VILSEGRMIITRRIIPSPPIQLVKLRQKRIVCGSISTFSIILAPVVVKPDDASKNVSTNEVIALLNIYGKLPNAENKIQEIDTVRKLSLILIFMTGVSFEIKKNMTETVIVTIDDQRKGYGDSLYMYATGKQSRNETVSMNRIVLNILRMTSGLINLILKSRNWKYKDNQI